MFVFFYSLGCLIYERDIKIIYCKSGEIHRYCDILHILKKHTQNNAKLNSLWHTFLMQISLKTWTLWLVGKHPVSSDDEHRFVLQYKNIDIFKNTKVADIKQIHGKVKCNLLLDDVQEVKWVSNIPLNAWLGSNEMGNVKTSVKIVAHGDGSVYTLFVMASSYQITLSQSDSAFILL